jgi:hypothetical protein
MSCEATLTLCTAMLLIVSYLIKCCGLIRRTLNLTWANRR